MYNSISRPAAVDDHTTAASEDCRTQQLDWCSNMDRRSMLLQAFSNSTGYQSAGESSLRYAA